MIDKNFIPPDPQTATLETQKRIELINWFANEIKPHVNTMMIIGSMSIGQNYSITAKSDIDIWLIVTKDKVESLKQTALFPKEELDHAISGYLKGYYNQFSINLKKDDVPIECHFWDEEALINAMTYKSQNTKRLRSGITTPSTDYAYSFDRIENAVDFYGEMIDGYAVGDFNSYRIVNDKYHLCRPIINVLGSDFILFTTPNFKNAIEDCWNETLELLKLQISKEPKFKDKIEEGLTQFNIENTLPSKNKLSKESLKRIQDRVKKIK